MQLGDHDPRPSGSADRLARLRLATIGVVAIATLVAAFVVSWPEALLLGLLMLGTILAQLEFSRRRLLGHLSTRATLWLTRGAGLVGIVSMALVIKYFS